MSAETMAVRRMLTEFDDLESRLIRLGREYPASGAPHADDVKAITKRILQGFGSARKTLEAIAHSNHVAEQREMAKKAGKRGGI